MLYSQHIVTESAKFKMFLHTGKTYRLHTGCSKSPLTTLHLNNLKIKSRIAKPNTYLKTRDLHYFLIPNMMLELVLLKIYKLNKFSGPISKISCFAYSHKHGLSLNQMLFTNAVFCSILSLIKLQKSDYRLLSDTPLCFALFVSCKGTSLNPSAKCYALLLISVLCVLPKVKDRPLWTFSIAGLTASIMAAESLSFLSTTARYIWPVFKNLLTNIS